MGPNPPKSVENTPKSDEKMFDDLSPICHVCNEQFANSSTLRQHMKLVHIEMVQTGGISISPDKGRNLRRRNDRYSDVSYKIPDILIP